MKSAQLFRPVLVDRGSGEHVKVIGDEQVIKLDSSQTGGTLAIIEQSYRPGAGVPLHFHTQEDAVFYIVQGHMDFTVGGKAISAAIGSTVLLPRGIPHCSKAGPLGAKALVVLFPGGGEKMFRELDSIPSSNSPSEEVTEVCKKYGVHFI
ncbi:MAG TPA: cupin domain-containing protein [Terriglobales bacterium]|nr:cupin domain-containing protein [Terriglobales bacterium]